MGFSNDASGKARRAVRMALNELGRIGVDDVRSTINERVTRGPGYVIRSEPFEYPYRDTSRLWKGIRYKVSAGAARLVDLVIYVAASVRHAIWLEYGTQNMAPRPFWEKFRNRFKRYAPGLFKKLVAKHLRPRRGPRPRIRRIR